MKIIYEVYAEPTDGSGNSEIISEFITKREAQLFVANAEHDNTGLEYWIEERVVNE